MHDLGTTVNTWEKGYNNYGPWLRDLLARPDAPVHPLLDTSAISSAIETATGPDLRHAGEPVLQLDTWLRQNAVEVEV